MTNPIPTGGPIPAGVIAGIDETVISHGGGVTYVLAGVVFANAQPARRAFQQLTANRQRPFHWKKEGPTLRQEAVTLLETHVVATYLLARTAGRRGQVAARRKLLACLVAELTNDGVDHVIIESQGPALDGRDRNTILDSSRADSAGPALTYEWRTKTEPLLWYPDALAGVAHEHLTNEQPHHFQQLQRTGVVTEIHYVADQPPEMRKPRLPS